MYQVSLFVPCGLEWALLSPLKFNHNQLLFFTYVNDHPIAHESLIAVRCDQQPKGSYYIPYTILQGSHAIVVV